MQLKNKCTILNTLYFYTKCNSRYWLQEMHRNIVI